MEFKLRNTYQSFERDIQKLKKLNTDSKTKYHKYFCVLVDAFCNGYDGRLEKLKSEHGIISENHISFPTKKYGYESEMCCHLILLAVT